MSWLSRIGLFAAGLFLMSLAKRQLDTGHFIFTNASFHQTTFAGSGLGVGLVLMLTAFLPPKDWVYRHITTRPRQPANPDLRHKHRTHNK